MSEKKILEKSPFAGIAVPIAIVLVGALIIFGITKMLSTGKDHKDLINELHSKTFRNRWTTAYELSKYIASNKIPKEDIPWVTENLNEIYLSSAEPRTRNFIVLALAAMGHRDGVETFNRALNDSDEKVRFNAVVGIGKIQDAEQADWVKLQELVQGKDKGISQAIFLAAASHKRPEFETLMEQALQEEDRSVRYAAARALINYRNSKALPVLDQILSLTYGDKSFNDAQVEALKLSTLRVITNNKWKVLTSKILELAKNDASEKVRLKASALSNSLKNW